MCFPLACRFLLLALPAPSHPSPTRSLALWAGSLFLHFPPTADQCTVSSPASHCQGRVQLSEAAMLAAFNASPWGFAVSFLWRPQGLPGLGQFQHLSCERFPPSALSSRVCIIMITGNGLSILQLSKALPTLYSQCLLIFTFSLKAKQNKQELYNHFNLTFGVTKKKKERKKIGSIWVPLKVSAAWWFPCFVLFSSLSSSPYHPPLPPSWSLRTIHVVIVFNTAHQKHLTTGFNLWFLAAWCTIKSVVLSQYQRKSWRTIKFKIIVLEIMIACCTH